MEALADAVGLWALGLGAAVIDVLDRQVELVLVAFPAAELGAVIGQHSAQPDAVLIIERHHPIVEDLGGGDWRLAVIELGEGHLGVGVDKGLLINPLRRPSAYPRRRCPARRNSPGTRSRTRHALPYRPWLSRAR